MLSKTIVFSPFSRLEGDLEVKVDIEGGRIVRSLASGTLYRGFESMLRGRDPLDAIVFTCRVCGQCGVAHSVAAATAIRALTGAEMPPNAYLASNVMLAIETILSHLTQFYLSFVPDLVDPARDSEAVERFLPPAGRSPAGALRAREEILGVLGLFAGKWPNTLAIQPGGTTRPVSASEIRRAQRLLSEFREFIEQQVFGCEADKWLALRSARGLDRWLGQGSHAASDVGFFVTRALERGLDKIGAWASCFISSGGWVGPAGWTRMRPGFHDGHPGIPRGGQSCPPRRHGLLRAVGKTAHRATSAGTSYPPSSANQALQLRSCTPAPVSGTMRSISISSSMRLSPANSRTSWSGISPTGRVMREMK